MSSLQMFYSLSAIKRYINHSCKTLGAGSTSHNANWVASGAVRLIPWVFQLWGRGKFEYMAQAWLVVFE